MFAVCSFCGERPVVAWFEGPDFVVPVRTADQVRAEEAWLACSRCLLLVQVDDREGLARLGTKRMRGECDPERKIAIVRADHERIFWAVRSA